MPNIHLSAFDGPVLVSIQPPSLRCVGRCDSVTSYDAPCHAHPCAEVVFVQRGAGTVFIEEESHPLYPGAVAIYEAGQRHRERFPQGGEELLFYHANLDDFDISCLPVNRLLPAGAPRVLDAGPQAGALQTLFALLFEEAERGQIGCHQILDDLTSALFTLLLRVLTENKVQIPLASGHSIVFNVQQYIMTHYQSSLTVQSLADTFHVDACYLSHAFKKAVGLSPKQYISVFRANVAGRLLKSGNAPLPMIAEAAGFGTVAALSLAFEKHKRMSPGDYRKKARETPLFMVE